MDSIVLLYFNSCIGYNVCVLRPIVINKYMGFGLKLKNIFTTIVFYPLFIVPYLIYVLLNKLSWLVQHIFTLVYIERICGYKHNQKITQVINSLQKLPQNVILTFSLTKSQILTEHSNHQKVIENKIVQDYVNILSKINHLQSITIITEQNCEEMGKFIDGLKDRVGGKVVNVVGYERKQKEYTQQLRLPATNGAPLLLVFSNYESTCHVPSKYLINAEIAFNKPLLSSTKYDLYRSFCQYSHSKQRNGK